MRPPIYGKPGPVKVAPSRFDTLPTLTGFAVIDSDGRPVAERESHDDATDIAGTLNDAAMGDARDLARAIQCLTVF